MTPLPLADAFNLLLDSCFQGSQVQPVQVALAHLRKTWRQYLVAHAQLLGQSCVHLPDQLDPLSQGAEGRCICVQRLKYGSGPKMGKIG
ncbi:hypothetical protein D3C77_154580 [compost metagenome]